MRVPYSGPGLIVGTLLAAGALVSAERSARAGVCAASDICAAGSSICTIRATFEIRAGCVNDFATRPVTLTGTLRSEVPGQGFTIRAPSLTLDGGDLLATGASGSKGGAIGVEVAGPFRMLGSTPRMSMDSAGLKGAITLTAGSIDIETGSVSANGTDGGPAIALEATGALILRTHDRRGRRFQRRVPRPARPFEQPSLNGLLRGPRRASIAGTGVPSGCTHLLMWGQRVGRLPHFGRSHQSGRTEGQANGE